MLEPDSVFEDVVDEPAEEAVVDPEEGGHQLTQMDNGAGEACFGA